MKILVVAQSVPWSSWNTKINLLKEWYKPIIDLTVDLLHVNFSEVKFDRNVQVDRKWMETNIIPRAKGYDLVYFQMNVFDWKAYPMQAAYLGQIGGIHVIEGGNEEFGDYNFFGYKYPGDLWFNLARHELAHALYFIHGKLDKTHEYYETYRIDKLLEDLKTMKTVTVKRNKSELKQTTGTLTVDGFTCATLERPDLNNKPNVSSIPKGEYICKYTFSPKFMKYTYEIKNVPGRSGIRIHSGNYFFDIQGCILLGTGYSDLNKDGTKDIINSKLTIKKFENLMGKKDFKLIIK